MNKSEQMDKDFKRRNNKAADTHQDVFNTGEDEPLLAKLKSLKKGPNQNLALLSSEEIRVGALIWKPTGLLRDTERELTRADWEETGRLLKMLDSSMQWLIGDWLLAAEGLQYGDLEQFATTLGFSVKTIYEYGYVARSVEFSIRMENLDFGHHQVVAAMSQTEQIHWLNRAIDGDSGKRWSVARLRKEIEEAKNGKVIPPPPAQIWIRKQAQERDRIRKSFEKSDQRGTKEGIINLAKDQSLYWQKFAQELEEQMQKGKL